jgi:hypothetical protein
VLVTRGGGVRQGLRLTPHNGGMRRSIAVRVRSACTVAGLALAGFALSACNGASSADNTRTALAGENTPAVRVDTTAVSETPLAPSTVVVTDLGRLSVNLAGVKMSPDGSKLLGFDSSGYMIGAADGSGLQPIDPHAIVVAVEWAPDSRSFAMTVASGPLSNEHQQLPLFVVHADDLSRQQIGMSDFPRYVQFLQNGDLAYVENAQLHVWHAATAQDERLSTAPITGASDGLTVEVPFRVSEDERFVAVFQNDELSVQGLLTAEQHVVATELDASGWSGYAWSPVSAVLAYSDQDDKRVPAIHLYDAANGSTSTLVRMPDQRLITPLEWTADGSWVIFNADGGGTEFLHGDFFAVDPTGGSGVPLFSDGSWFELFNQGRSVLFYREPLNGPGEYWRGTLNYR